MNAMIDYPPDATTGEPNECTPCATCDECDVCMGPCLAVSDDPPGARPSLGELNPPYTSLGVCEAALQWSVGLYSARDFFLPEMPQRRLRGRKDKLIGADAPPRKTMRRSVNVNRHTFNAEEVMALNA